MYAMFHQQTRNWSRISEVIEFQVMLHEIKKAVISPDSTHDGNPGGIQMCHGVKEERKNNAEQDYSALDEKTPANTKKQFRTTRGRYHITCLWEMTW
jgi:hypothetical protein